MELGLIVAGAVTFFSLWASLWYKLGKITNQVKHHNLVLEEIRKQLEHLLTRGG